MAKSEKREPEDRPRVYDWDTPGNRIAWLLNNRFAGNRSEMAREVDVSPSAISRVVAGVKPPGRRLLTAIVAKLGVDAEWLLSGRGEPFGIKPDGPDTPIHMPLSDRLLAEPLPKQLRELSDRTVVIPAIRPSTQYLFRLKPDHPLVREPAFGFRGGDLLVLETDPVKFPSQERLNEHLCAVRVEARGDATVKLGAVLCREAGVDSGPARLEFDPFEHQPEEIVEEHVFRRHADGTVEAVQRRSRRRQHRGRVVYVPVEQDAGVEPPPLRIKYTDVVAVWTGLLFRRGRGPFG